MLTSKEFYTRPNYFNKVLKKYNSKYYLIEEKNLINNDIRVDILLTEEQIINYLNDQDFIILKVKKAIESHNRMLKIEKQEQEKKEEEEKAYNNIYGYAINLSPMQKGKILKILNKKENYYNNGEYIDTMTRKDFIKNKLENGYYLEHKTNIKYWNKKGEIITKKNEYRLLEKEGTFYELNKTEYEYASHLVNKCIINNVL